MPTARFEADFSSFVSGAAQADTALAQLETESAATGAALDSVSSSATATADNLSAVESSAASAGDAMASVGSEGAAGMKDAAEATQEASDAGGVLDEVWQGVIGTFGGFGIERLTEQLIEFGEHTIETGAQIDKLSLATGLSTDAIQQWSYVAGQTETSINTIARAVETLEQRIGSGDKNLTKAVEDLGLSMDDLKSQTPEEAFKTMLDALHGVEDQSRQNADANDAFSRSYRDLLPLIKSNYETMLDAAPKMSEEYTADLANIEHAWNSLKSTLVVDVGSMIGTIAELSSKMDDMTKRVESWNLWTSIGQLQDIHDKGFDAATGIGALVDAQLKAKPAAEDFGAVQHGIAMSDKELSAVTKELNDDVKSQIAAEEPLAKAWDEIRTKTVDWNAALAQLDGTVVESVKSLLDMHVSEKAISEVYELRPEQVHAIAEARKDDIEQMKEQAKADKELVDQEARGAQQILDEWQKTSDTIKKLTMDSTDYQIAKVNEAADKQKAAFKGTADQFAEFAAAVDQQTAVQTLSILEAADKQALAHEAGSKRALDAHTNAAKGSAGAWQTFADGEPAVADKAAKAWDTYVKEMNLVAELSATAPAAADAAAKKATDALNAAMDDAAKNMTVVVGASDDLAKAQVGAATECDNLGGSLGRLASQVNSAIQGWAAQNTQLLQGSAAGQTDPRILNYLSMGYTASEAAAIVSGSGASINIPTGARLSALGAAESGTYNVTINNHGLMATDKSSLNSAISDSVMQALKSVRKLGRA